MAATRPRSTRNTRKRRRLDDGNISNQDTKRRKKIQKYSERSTQGFCQHCTNPYKLITCKQCFRSWHLNCLTKHYSINPNLNSNHENTQISLKPITRHNIDEHKEFEQTPSPSPTLSDEYKQDMNNHNKLSNQISSSSNFKIPQKLQISSKYSNANGIAPEISQWKKQDSRGRSKKLRPDPIQITSMPFKCEKMTDIDHMHQMNTWFKQISPSVHMQEPLHSDTFTKQIVAIFECSDCVNNTHCCFICKSRNKSMDDGNVEPPQMCNNQTCGKFYHKSCLKEDKFYSQHTRFCQNGSIQCPAHHCWTCYNLVSYHGGAARKTCWYCPRSYHRNCVPETAELMSVQTTDSNDELSKYPDFRYDLITCCWNDEDKPDISQRLTPFHPKPKDLQFGRNDAKAGIFKWKLWDNTMAEFYRLNDDPFSIDIRLLNQYQAKTDRKKKSQRHNTCNPWPKNFKRIKRSKYVGDCKKPAAKPDYGRCSCFEGCQLNLSCMNYGMDIECNDEICGAKDPSLCSNRQWARTVWTDNVQIRLTEITGFGAFAKKDLNANQLIIEYVGEMISKQESKKRMAMLNDAKAANFYLLQMEGNIIIDATNYGNESRFFNHSCDPNCHAVKWIVRGQERLGIFALKDIKKGTELTYDYEYEVPNTDEVEKLAKCMCGSRNCRFYLGFNKKKAREWKEKLILEGEWVESEDEDENQDDDRKKKKKKRKRKRKSKKKRKKKKKSKKKRRKSMYQSEMKEKEKEKEIEEEHDLKMVEKEMMEMKDEEEIEEDNDVLMDNNKENENILNAL